MGRIDLMTTPWTWPRRTILLKGTFPNTNTVLWPGQFVQVAMTLSQISTRSSCRRRRFRRGQNGQYLFPLKPDETVEMRAVTTGENFDGNTIVRAD